MTQIEDKLKDSESLDENYFHANKELDEDLSNASIADSLMNENYNSEDKHAVGFPGPGESDLVDLIAAGIYFGFIGFGLYSLVFSGSPNYQKIKYDKVKINSYSVNHSVTDHCPPDKLLLVNPNSEVVSLIDRLRSKSKTFEFVKDKDSYRYDFTFYLDGKVNKDYECSLYQITNEVKK